MTPQASGEESFFKHFLKEAAILATLMNFLVLPIGVKSVLSLIQNLAEVPTLSVSLGIIIADVSVRTLPLVVVTAVVFVLASRGALPTGWPGLGAVVLLLVAAAFVGNYLSSLFGTGIIAVTLNPGTSRNLILVLFGILQNYLTAYGLPLFISALLTGYFYGRWILKWLDEHGV